MVITGEQVQEPFGEHPPLRVFQSVPSAPQVADHHHHHHEDQIISKPFDINIKVDPHICNYFMP